MSRGAACGPPFGMGWDVESSCGPGLGFPLGCGSSLGFRVCDWPVEGEYSTCVHIASRGSCHFWPSGITLTPSGRLGTGSSPLPTEGEGTGRPSLAASGDGFRLGGGPGAVQAQDHQDRVGGGDNQVELLLCGHPPPAHTSKASARAAPAPPTGVLCKGLIEGESIGHPLVLSVGVVEWPYRWEWELWRVR